MVFLLALEREGDIIMVLWFLFLRESFRDPY